MSIKNNEQAVINLVINGQAANASLRELSGTYNALYAAVSKLKQADDPALYAEKVKLLGQVKAARDAERDSIIGTADASKKFNSDFKAGMSEMNGSISKFREGLETVKSGLETLGIGIGLGELISFGKELLGIEVKASGIENAFAKIGNTDGVIEKLRASSRGLISDMDLEKIEIKANNANIPLDKMGMFLQFAQQRARDTGEDVTELTDKLINGLGKGTPKALAGLGVSVAEVKKEFKETGDMVEAVSNIIKRQMLAAGQDVETFGDVILKQGTKIDNLKDKIAKLWAKLFTPDLADSESIQHQTDIEMKQFGDLGKISDDQLDKAITEQADRQKKAQASYDEAQAQLAKVKQDAKEKNGDQAVNNDFSEEEDNAKTMAEYYQGVRNSLAALNKEKDKRSGKAKDGSVEGIEQEITKLKDLQNQLSTTSADWNKYEVQIKKLQGQEAAITGKKNPADKKAENERAAALKEFNELAVQKKQFEAGELADTMAKNDKEQALLEKKYNDFIQKELDYLTKSGVTKQQAAATNATISSLETEKEQAIIDLRIRQAKELNDKLNAFREQMSGKLATELQKEEDQINKFYDDQKRNVGQNPDGQAKIEADRQAAITDAKLREEQRFQQEKNKLEETLNVDPARKDEIEKARIKKKYDDEISALKAKYSTEIQATKEFQALISAIQKQSNDEQSAADDHYLKQKIDAAIKAAQDISNALFTISANNRHSEENAQIAQLENEKNAELSNADLTQTQKDAINQKYAKQESDLKLQAWEADKKASLEQAIINGALAITKTFAEYGFSPLGWIAAGAQAVAVAAQVAVIENQQPPQFATGGMIPSGPSHADGGIDLVNKKTGQTIGNIEGGEPVMVLSKETRENNGPLIKQLLFNSLYRNGASVDTGGVSRGVQSAKSGALFNQGAAASFSNQGGAPVINNHIDVSELVSEMRLTRQAIKDQKVTLNRRAWDVEDSKVVQIQNNANA